MIVHCVFCRLASDHDEAECSAVIDGLSQLCATLDGVLSFEAGQNRDFEGKSQEHPYGFVIRFRDMAALSAYADHPIHRALGARLCDLCEGGAAGIVVYDIEPEA